MLHKCLLVCGGLVIVLTALSTALLLVSRRPVSPVIIPVDLDPALVIRQATPCQRKGLALMECRRQDRAGMVYYHYRPTDNRVTDTRFEPTSGLTAAALVLAWGSPVGVSYRSGTGTVLYWPHYQVGLAAGFFSPSSTVTYIRWDSGPVTGWQGFRNP